MRIISNKGFTLVETLVAIAILMVAVVGPLTVANKAYRAAIDAKKQTIAFNLAQEGLEYINNLKDNKDTSSNWGAWNGNSHPAVFDNCASPTLTCQITALGALPSGFTRYYNYQWVSYYQVLATVVVSWQTGTVGNQVRLQELISYYTR